MSKVITKSEAMNIFSQEADFMPYRKLTIFGCKFVNDWVKKTSSANIGQDGISAWHQDAEKTANNALMGEDIIIEMPARHTRSGRPETLCLEEGHFEWHVFDETVKSYRESLEEQFKRIKA